MSWIGFGHGGGRPLHEAMICRQCEAALSSAFDVPLAALRASRRSRARHALARAGAIYLARISFGLAETTVGRAFGRHRSTIGHACRRIDERRACDRSMRHGLLCLEHALARHVARRWQDAAMAGNGETPEVAR